MKVQEIQAAVPTLDAERALRTGRPDPEKAKAETVGAVSAGTAYGRLVDRLA